MKITALVENTVMVDGLGCEHGLSLYVETMDHKLLVDVGASGLFLENASKLGVDIAGVESVVISHGHYDHGGGLATFLQANTRARVFIHRRALDNYYAARPHGKLDPIGLDAELRGNPRVVLTTDRFPLGSGMELFAGVTHTDPLPQGNRSLFMERDGKIVEDTFDHEQNLIIEENGQTLLITGCAHNGIVNIVKHFGRIKGYMPQWVIGGFHLSNPAQGGSEELQIIDQIGRYLLSTKAKYYTGHCTGLTSFRRLKSVMGESIDYLAAGSELLLPSV